MNGRPLSMRKKIQILLALTILAWATQTLLHQWARGADLPPEVATVAPSDGFAPAAIPGKGAFDQPPAPPAEHFVPTPQRYGTGVTLELRAEATTLGPDVRLKQICRWSAADAATFVPVADLVVLRLDEKTPFRSISLDELQALLRDARVNLSSIKFAGPLMCTVHRTDAPVEQKDALEKWIDAREGAAPETPAAAAPRTPASVAGQPALAAPAAAIRAAASLPASASAAPVSRIAPAAAAAVTAAPVADPPATRSLRQAITEDLAVRLALPIEQLQLTFNPKDDRVLNLCEPQFRFNLEATRARNLGDVSWDVLIVHTGGTQKASINAVARAFQFQLILNKPLSARQIIRAEDVTERRVLVDRMSDEPLLTAAQAVGQEASRDLKPMTVLSSRMVDSVPLVKSGQFVTITVSQGGIHVKTVGRAMETGSFGQSIRVKNETTNDIYQVCLTGPQEGVIGQP